MLSNSSPLPPTTTRKRKLAAKLANKDNVAKPTLKQQKLALNKCHKVTIKDVVDIDASSSKAVSLKPENFLEAADSDDDDLPLASSASKPKASPPDSPLTSPPNLVPWLFKVVMIKISLKSLFQVRRSR